MATDEAMVSYVTSLFKCIATEQALEVVRKQLQDKNATIRIILNLSLIRLSDHHQFQIRGNVLQTETWLCCGLPSFSYCSKSKHEVEQKSQHFYWRSHQVTGLDIGQHMSEDQDQ